MQVKNKEKNLEYYSKLPYTIILEIWDDSDGPYYVARVAELPHCIIHGDTPQEAITEIEEVKLDWIKSNLDRGLNIPEPTSHNHSGQISLRIPPFLHKTLADRALIEGSSLNQYLTAALASSIGLNLLLRKKKAGEKPARV